MIYPITDIFSIRTEIIEEKDNDMNAFMDKLHSALHKIEKGIFRTPDRRIFKAVLIKREDIYKETEINMQLSRHSSVCIAKSRVKVVLKYTFKEFI